MNAWHTDVADGDFQLTSHWSTNGLTPYTMYDSWLDSSLATGSAATGDYERLNDPAIQADLATLAGASTTAQQTAALAPIAKFVAADLPIIPTTTASDWFEYNSQNYTGWPTQDNPYESGQPSGTNNGPGSGTDEVVILHLHSGEPRLLRGDRAGPPPANPPTGGGPHPKIPTITLAQLLPQGSVRG